MLTQKQSLCSVLIVSGSAKGVSFIKALLKPSSFSPVTVAANAGEAKRLLISTPYDIIIIDAPLSDEFGYELAANLASETPSGILLLVRNENYEQIANRVESYGVFTVAKPITQLSFYHSVKLVVATRERMRALENKNINLQSKMDEIRLVNRAKWVLIERLSMTEPQAHRYIEKQAMDLRTSRREVAQSIIKAHEA